MGGVEKNIVPLLSSRELSALGTLRYAFAFNVQKIGKETRQGTI